MRRWIRVSLFWAAMGWAASFGHAAAASGRVSAGGFSPADSGWTALFNGKDFEGLYIRNNGGTLRDPATQGSFEIRDGAIRVPRTGGVGHLATKAVHSRYHVRVEYRYGPGQQNPNAGLLYHIDTADWKASAAAGSKDPAVPYFMGAYVKSVELQMYRGDAGAFLGIMNIWVTADTKGDGNHTWQAGGTPYTAVPSNDLAPRRIYRSHNAAPADTDWVLLEGLIYGSDSVTHRVNGSVVMRGRNLLHNGKTAVSPDTAGRTRMEKGHIGLQTEGAEVWYRNWEIRRLRADGTPIIPGCTLPHAPNYNPLANEDDGSCKSTATRRGAERRVGRGSRDRTPGPFFGAGAGSADALGRSIPASQPFNLPENLRR